MRVLYDVDSDVPPSFYLVVPRATSGYTSGELPIREVVSGAREHSSPQAIAGLRQEIDRLDQFRADAALAGPGGIRMLLQAKFSSRSNATMLSRYGELTKIIAAFADCRGRMGFELPSLFEAETIPAPRPVPWSPLLETTSGSLAVKAIRRLPDLSRESLPSTLPNSSPRVELAIPQQVLHDVFAAFLRMLDDQLVRLRLLLFIALAALTRTACVAAFVLVLIAVCLRYGLRHEPSDDDERFLLRTPELIRRGE
ncbi:hypothetical protein SAMN04489712_104108 [Thermomonospora echinospora]|uniref:Uncharacterized protein n=1 Tax=Thermomonospora echinospora TaxID=1992 RepID=A0A1H5YPW1_9ACTN|nr:hypothetical protein [Thermomonospora echinospora]SEG25810.1 hypothetical protein SAMN04489712_104108 [Thermomonospora echinospora]